MKIHRVLVAAVLTLPCLATAADPPAADSRAGEPPTIAITDLIERVAKKTSRTFVLDPRVRGDVPMTALDVDRVDYPRLLAILAVNNFATVQGRGFVRIVPDANARQLPTRTHTDLAFKADDDEIVTLLLEGRNVCVAQTVPVLRPLLPQAAHLAALPQANVLIINDRAANVRRIGEIFERLDRGAPAGQKCDGAG